MARKKKDNTAEIGFEEQIWRAADKLRGNIDASEYKNVVLGLIFLKYISDKFDQRHQELIDEGEGFEEDRDEYTYKNIFWVPREARWDTIASAAHTPEIGKVIDNAMRLIEAENDRLKGILPKNFARQELDKRRLGEVVDLFTNVQMAEKGDTRDILGRTYEYCLAKFAEAEGKNAGEFYTPACVVRTLVEIITALTTAGCMTPAVARVACSCNPPSSFAAIRATLTTCPSSDRKATLPRGRWQ